MSVSNGFPSDELSALALVGDDPDAADVLVRHLFTPEPHTIAGVEYAVDYRVAVGRSGGDIVDAFPLEDGSVSIVVADISGKGTRASVQAALVKFSLRSFASADMAPGECLRRLDRLYRETVRFEASPSFVTVFVGRISPSRRLMTYASAGHDVIACKAPGERAASLQVTGPAVGILPDFFVEERRVELDLGTTIVLATDGVSDSRSKDEFFGTSGFLASIDRRGERSLDDLVCGIGDDAQAFNDRETRDDIAVLAARTTARY